MAKTNNYGIKIKTADGKEQIFPIRVKWEDVIVIPSQRFQYFAERKAIRVLK